jgi:NADH dehydrogenase FAD-containing subunit
MTSPTIVVIGGGYAGARVAQALDDDGHVVLIEPKDAFHHNVAALRGLVDPAVLHRTFFPYDKLLTHGTVQRDRAVAVDSHQVQLASGGELTPDYLVLATGSTYPFPAKSGHAEHADALSEYTALYGNLGKARRVLLLGAGPVGLELAGELRAAFPEIQVTLVDPSPEILPGGFDPWLRDELNRQLDKLGVERVLGSPLTALPPTEPGEMQPITVSTVDGRTVEADLWLRCYGVSPVSGYLTGDLAGARTPDGYVAVDAQLRVAAFDHVYALGDVVAIDANMAGIARRQSDVVVANIRAAIAGNPERSAYEINPPGILLPLGPTGGAGFFPGRGQLEAETVSQLKGADMLVSAIEELFRRPK